MCLERQQQTKYTWYTNMYIHIYPLALTEVRLWQEFKILTNPNWKNNQTKNLGINTQTIKYNLKLINMLTGTTYVFFSLAHTLIFKRSIGFVEASIDMKTNVICISFYINKQSFLHFQSLSLSLQIIHIFLIKKSKYEMDWYW